MMGGIVSDSDFTDYYELMQLSPNADPDTIERIFRHFAMKFHPDNISGEESRFRQIVEAHRALSDPETRAAYDVKHQDYWDRRWKIASQASDSSSFDNDQATREQMLSLLYVQRRRNMVNPGMGGYDIAKLLGIPIEIVEFHVWYLKAKGWLERMETGQLAISALGVDQVEQTRLRLMPDRLLENRGGSVGSDDTLTDQGNSL